MPSLLSDSIENVAIDRIDTFRIDIHILDAEGYSKESSAPGEISFTDLFLAKVNKFNAD